MTTSTFAKLHGPADNAGSTRSSDTLVQVWLTFVAMLVIAMIVVGGATRLTDSGLSITEWQPLLGAIPPLTEADWQAAFAKYQTIPQYTSVNKGMSLDAFKAIYWWEWAHRFLGRFIGLVYALPLAWFWLTGKVRAGWRLRLLAVLGLGGLQGAIGWYMVKSGLADRIDVSPYRLALHLSVAFVLLSALVWLILELSPRRVTSRDLAQNSSQTSFANALAVLVFVQVILGGFVAGLKAGRAFNTWPLMDGHVIPDGFARLTPWWLNLTENMATVQFNHRLLAYLVVALAIANATRLLLRNRLAEPLATSGAALAAGLVAQMTLGIATVILAVPIGLGVAHQGLAAIVMALAIWHTHTAQLNERERVS
jgi:heme a synthase